MSETLTLVSRRDVERLRILVPENRSPAAHGAAHLEHLAESVYEGSPVAPGEIPPNIVTMDSIVRIRNLESGEVSTYRLVFPQDADMKVRSISVLSPVGAALFGRRIGDRFEVHLPSGRTRRFQVVEIVFQPEAAGILE